MRLLGTWKLMHLNLVGSKPVGIWKLRPAVYSISIVLDQNSVMMFIILIRFLPITSLVLMVVVLYSLWILRGPYPKLDWSSRLCECSYESLMGMSFWSRLTWSWMQLWIQWVTETEKAKMQRKKLNFFIVRVDNLEPQVFLLNNDKYRISSTQKVRIVTFE